MPERQPDLVDLMLEGKFHDAAETYLELYEEGSSRSGKHRQ